MKVRRNGLCPCGSGKKFKRCCLSKDSGSSSDNDDVAQAARSDLASVLQLKGKTAEAVVHQLAEKTFLTDWCFANPLLPDGKELCDLLVVFDTIAIIFQVKDLKLDDSGKYKQAEVEKNLRQLAGARRQLFELRTSIALTNPRRYPFKFDPTLIREIFLVSILMGEEESFSSVAEEFKKHTVHVFSRIFTSIVMKELDTIVDFCADLRVKEQGLRKKQLFITGGEEELLGYYLLNGRSLATLNDADSIFLDEGFWENLRRRPEFLAKKQADEISYRWDEMIDIAHTTGSPEYELIAREMARTSRFLRRSLVKAFVEAQLLSQQYKGEQVFRRVIPAEGVTYCFLFDDRANRENRRTILKHLAYVARGKFPANKKVLGIATGKTIQANPSYEFLLFEKEEWTEADRRKMAELQAVSGLLTNVNEQRVSEEEYPSGALEGDSPKEKD